MRHRQKKAKLGRTPDHRDAMLANLACSLIEHERICTTLARAKALRPFAEKMVTLAKKGDLHSRRLAISRLRAQPHWKKVKMGKRVDHVAKLFEQIAPACEERQGGYTRILKLPRRYEDSAPMAYIEWVDRPGEAPEVEVVDEKETAAAKA
jgi:large subunit ribosomal protein L17